MTFYLVVPLIVGWMALRKCPQQTGAGGGDAGTGIIRSTLIPSTALRGGRVSNLANAECWRCCGIGCAM
jgi:hypothetical protein